MNARDERAREKRKRVHQRLLWRERRRARAARNKPAWQNHSVQTRGKQAPPPLPAAAASACVEHNIRRMWSTKCMR